MLGSNTTSEGGVITTTSMTRGGLGTTIVFNVGDLAFVIEYSTTVGCRNLDVPACPTASGAADAQRDTVDRLRVDVRRDGRLVSSQRSSARRHTKTHGQTAGDAKLDTIDVDDTVTINTTANGVSIAGRLTRRMRINMRSEQVEPSQSTATFVGAAALQRSDNGNFASLAAGIIGVYRSAESAPDRLGIGGGWAVFDRINSGSYCITGRFNPARQTIKVKKGRSGSFTGQAISQRDGGAAADSRWEKAEQFNGTFSPDRLSGSSVTSNYTVTNAGFNDLLSVEYKVTSTAGVAKLNWSQETEPSTINHIRGGFNGTQTIGADSVLAFAGTLRFDRFAPSLGGPSDGVFRFAGGEYTVNASGRDQSGVTLCRQTGTKHFTIPPGSGSLQSDGSGPDRVAPYSYTLQALQPAQTMTITRIACPPNTDPGNGTTFVAGLNLPFQTTRTHSSPDGISFADTEDQGVSGLAFRWSWSLTGTEE